MIRMLLVDDSALIRSLLKQLFGTDDRFEVAGEATNGKEAVEKARMGNIDLIIMDINMPVMDGIEATRQISAFSSAAIVMFTTEDSMDSTYKSISAGALEVLSKPNVTEMTDSMLQEFREKIYVISQTRKNKAVFYRTGKPLPKASDAAASFDGQKIPRRNYDLLLIGSSTGGPSALQAILRGLQEDFPIPILITQHIDKLFDSQLVKWLDDTTAFSVTLAKNGERPEKGHVYVAPSDRHLVISKVAGACFMELDASPPLHFLRPSVDKMFSSAATALGDKALAIVLTGMGRDGADGAVEIRKAGGSVLAQDEESCIVFGMPKAVIEAGAAQAVLPLDKIGPAVQAAVIRP